MKVFNRAVFWESKRYTAGMKVPESYLESPHTNKGYVSEKASGKKDKGAKAKTETKESPKGK